MTAMRTLVTYEIKKILDNRAGMAACVIVWILLVAIAVANIMTAGARDGDTGAWMEGIAAHQAVRENEQAKAGVLDDARISADLAAYDQALARWDEMASELNSMSSEEIIEQYGIEFWHDVHKVVVSSYYQRLDAVLALDAQGTRARSLEEGSKTAIAHELSGNYLGFFPYTQAEHDYWTEKAEKVSWPIEYGYAGAWDGIFNWMSFYALVILAAAIAVSGVYAGEYQNRTAAVVLPTRNGTCMLPLAKTTAALVFASTYYLLCVGSICGIYLAILGPDGAGLPCQIFDFASPYPYSVGAVCGLCLLVGYVVCLGATAFTLLLSSKLRSVMPVAVVPLAVILLGILGKLITPLAKIADLTPMTGFNDMFSAMVSYAVGPIVFDLPSMLALLYGALLAACVPLSIRMFRRHQVM